MRIKSNDGDRKNTKSDVGGSQAIGLGAERTDFSYPGFKDLFAELAAGNGKTLVHWLQSEAQWKGIQEKDIPGSIGISPEDYGKLISGPEQSMTLCAAVFANVADWLQISIVGTLAAAGVSNLDARHDQLLKVQCIDFALDKIARHPTLGMLLPIEKYLAEERVREGFVRLYQEEMGAQLIPEEVNWDEILDAMMVLQVQSRAYCH